MTASAATQRGLLGSGVTRGRALRVLRESVVSALSQPVATVITLVVIASMCAAVLLTSGRTVGAEQAVIGSIDSAGTRSIIVRSDAQAGLDSTVLDRIRTLQGVEWAAAFGPAQDARNSAISEGTLVPMRTAWAEDWTPLGLPETRYEGTAYASERALADLGFREPVGPVSLPNGADGWTVSGSLAVPDYLQFLEPVLLSPAAPDTTPAAVGVLVVIAERPDLVAPLADAVASVLAVDDPTMVSIQTSESLATLRGLIQGQLGSFGRELTFAILGVTGLLVAVLLYGVVTLRRKDFGRRRALGASQRLIVTLITVQTALISVAGAVLGTAIGLVVLITTGDPLPGIRYTVGVGLLAVTTAIIASIVPAVSAARREPIRELRVA